MTNCKKSKVVSHAVGTFLGFISFIAVMRGEYQFTTLASAGSIQAPNGVAVDNSGNVFIAQSSDATILKITPGGTVTTFAGQSGSTGATDGTGGAALFNFPQGLTVDGGGNVYVADTGNNAVRKITPQGEVTTIAGGSQGSTDGNGTSAKFQQPYGLAVDASGNIYVADTFNNSIRKISPVRDVTTLAGSTTPGHADGTGASATFLHPSSVAVDSSGNLFVADFSNHTIRKVTSGGVVTTLAGLAPVFDFVNGTGSAARFKSPKGVAVDNLGNIYVADTGNNVIRKITQDGVVTTFAGAATSGNADGNNTNVRFTSPEGVWVDASGNIYIADTGNNSVRKGVQVPELSSFTSQPASLTRVVAYSATFSASVTGAPTPTLQWQKNGADISGATSATLTISAVQSLDAGVYTLIATNTAGSVTSNPATLTVLTHAAVSDDLNGDGYCDFLWQNSVTGQRSVWFLSGTTFLGAQDLWNVDPAWNIVSAVDLNGDGKADLLWQNKTTGQRSVWYLNGITLLDAADLWNVDPSWDIVAVVDLNGDGKPDLLWQNKVSGHLSVWYLNGTTFLGSADLWDVDPAWSIASAVDLNGDGKADLLWQNKNTGQRSVWYLNGTTFLSAENLWTVDAAWVIAGTPDLNGDGKADLLWQNKNTGQRSVWYLNGTTILDGVNLWVVDPVWELTK